MRYPFNGQFKLNQGFGSNPQTYKQFGLAGHNGLDFGLPTGTPVVAAHSGKMTTGFDASGYGNFIRITGGGYESIYAHLQRFARPSGVNVSEGEVIGFSNNTGFSTGAHLHFGVRPVPANTSNGYGGYIDPLPLLTKGDEMYDNRTAEQWYLDANGWHVKYDALKKESDAEIARLLGHVQRGEAKIKALESELATLKAGAKVLTPGLYQVK